MPENNNILPYEFQKLYDTMKTRVTELSKLTLRRYRKEAEKDGLALLNEMKQDLERWTQKLYEGHLTTQEFEWLVQSHKDTFKMEALRQAGLNVVRVEQFNASLLNLLVDTIFDVVLPLAVKVIL